MPRPSPALLVLVLALPWHAVRPLVGISEAAMCEPRQLTSLEAAVVRLLTRADTIPMPQDLPARFVIKASEDPAAIMQMVYNSVDWDAITEHLEQTA
jgi:hypothetical protein